MTTNTASLPSNARPPAVSTCKRLCSMPAMRLREHEYLNGMCLSCGHIPLSSESSEIMVVLWYLLGALSWPFFRFNLESELVEVWIP